MSRAIQECSSVSRTRSLLASLMIRPRSPSYRNWCANCRRPPARPRRSAHTQTIGGNAQVGVAIAGDVLGGINHVQQSGGINLGSGNTIDRIGDLVAGDKIRSYAVVAIERFSACGSKVLILSVRPEGTRFFRS
jgi:hypothetical protein